MKSFDVSSAISQPQNPSPNPRIQIPSYNENECVSCKECADSQRARFMAKSFGASFPTSLSPASQLLVVSRSS